MNAPASPAFLDLARGRRSVRSYSPRPVGREKIERCLEAAGAAPSACDRQPWRFVVVVEPGARDRLAEAAFGGIYRSNSF
ncbi:MAG TPA: nitroreductase family protein, partial [bacterium]|nr:nitroreductase family protein [bacterium]